MADDDDDIPGLPNDPPPPKPPKDKGPSWWWMLGRPPLFWSYWLLVGLAEAGAVWLCWQVIPAYPAVLIGTLITAVAAMILKDSFTEYPPHRM